MRSIFFWLRKNISPKGNQSGSKTKYRTITNYLYEINPTTPKPKQIRKVDIKGNIVEPLKSTQLVIGREI